MVAESLAPGASVSKVAQRYGVNANLLFTWRRREARSAASGGVEAVEFLPVRVEDERAPPLGSLSVAWRSCLPPGNGSLSE
jgi:transposase